MPPHPPIKKSARSGNNLIGFRLRLEMKRRGLSSAELANRAGVKTSFLYDVISGKSANPSTVKLARVADILEISLAYLVGSTDEPAATQGSDKKRAKEEYVTIPRIAIDVSAGGGTLVSQENESERYAFRRAWIKEHLGVSVNDLRMLYVRGDSMEPTLSHNDIVLVDTTKKKPTPPGVFVLFDGFGLVVKRLEFVGRPKPERIRIMSDNPQYSAYERSPDEAVIVGRVVWFAREI